MKIDLKIYHLWTEYVNGKGLDVAHCELVTFTDIELHALRKSITDKDIEITYKHTHNEYNKRKDEYDDDIMTWGPNGINIDKDYKLEGFNIDGKEYIRGDKTLDEYFMEISVALNPVIVDYVMDNL